MQFYNANNKNALVQDTLFLCQTTTASYALADITRNLNQHYLDTNRMIWESQGEWQYDDSNATDFPIATDDLVHTQQDYSLPSTCQRVERVQILDINGNWEKLEPLDYKDVNIAMEDYLSAAGMPKYYDLFGSSIFLYPKPSSAYVTTTNGLEVFFSRTVTEFTTASTTAEPGFPSPFHRILSYGTALDFEKDSLQTQRLIRERDELMQGLKRFYSNRATEIVPEIMPKNKGKWRQYC